MNNVDSINEIQKTIDARDIIFWYSGYITEEALQGIGGTIKKKLGLVHVDRKVARSVFAIFVESVQNVIRYSQAVLRDEGGDDGEVLRHGLCAVGNTDGRYWGCCGNLVQRSDVARIDEHLNLIQGLDADGLKALYKEKLRADAPQDSKGAGVGFIDIARRATGGIEFGFIDVDGDDDHAYFYLKAYA